MKSKQWTHKTHLFCSDEYICPVCGALDNKPYKQCPSCGTLLGGSKYDPSWVDETEGLPALIADDV